MPDGTILDVPRGLRSGVSLPATNAEEGRFAALFHGSPVGMILTDDAGLVVAFNAQASRLLGYSEQAVVGRHLSDLLPLEDADRLIDVENNASGNTAERYLVQGRHQHGRRLPLRVSTIALHQGEEALRGVIIEDRRPEQLLEEQVRQAQKLEAVGTLARGVAHDFNNLLMGIGGCVQMVLDMLEDSHDARALLVDVLGGVNNGAQIARQLLTFGREHTGAPLVFDVNKVLAAQAVILGRLLGDNVRIDVEVDAAAAFVEMDPGLMDQVLLNLAVNARDAMPEGGVITIGSRLQPAAAGTEDDVVLCVVDDGTGMPAAVRKRAFEPFFTTKEGVGGSGLGLSTVYGIVAQAGGRVSLQSVEGLGTSVEVTLPTVAVAPPHRVETRASEAGPATATGGVALVVEDEPRVRLTTRYLLAKLGYRVLEARQLSEARECLTRFGGEIHLVLCDIALPDGRGPELLDAIARRAPGITVMFMSAHVLGGELAGRAGPAVGDRAALLHVPVLTKPFTEATLREHIVAAIEARPR